MLALMEYLNREGKYDCLCFNVEMAQAMREDVERGIRTILGELVSRASSSLDDRFPHTVWQQVLSEYGAGAALNRLLTL